MNGDEGEAVVAIHGVSRRFGPNMALDGVDLAVPRGVVFGVVGENGAGKTTLIKHMMWLMIDRGKVVLYGALDEIKESYRRLTLRFDEPQGQAPTFRGLLVCEGSGHEWTAVCRGSAVDIAGEAAALGARVVAEHTPSLDEIFVASVGARRHGTPVEV